MTIDNDNGTITGTVRSNDDKACAEALGFTVKYCKTYMTCGAEINVQCRKIFAKVSMSRI